MPTAVRRSAPRSLIFGALVAAALSATACSDDSEPSRLFEEEGTWELTSFAIAGTGIEDLSSSRSQTFLLSFDRTNRVVQTAMCSNDDFDSPNDSECAGFNDSMWICKCFGYAFEEDQMAWQEFDAGSTPPMVVLGETTPSGDVGGDGDTDTEGADEEGDGGGGGEEAPSGTAHQLSLVGVVGTAATYDFTSLPAGVFGSDGVSSKYIFQKKAASVFDVVFEDEERPTCEPCI